MHKTRLLLIGSASVCALGLTGAGYVWHVKREVGRQIGEEAAKQFFSEGPIKAVDLRGWSSLQTGMTREAVQSLLGEAQSQSRVDKMLVDGKPVPYAAYWEYNWRGVFHPHPKAYVVYFDKEGKLISWREPE